MKRKVLGKGLSALLPEQESIPEDRVQSIPLKLIKPARNQPRKFFNSVTLKELAASIREKGVILPVVVRSTTSGFELIAGERRWRAAKLAGLTQIPAVIKEVTDMAALEIAMIENLQREDLDPIESAVGYRMLMDEYGMTQEQISQKIGKERATVANTLRLLKLPQEIQTLIRSHSLSVGHAKALLGIPSRETMIQMASLAFNHEWSVRTLEDRVKKLMAGKTQARIPQDINPVLESSFESIRRRFSTKVTFKPKKSGGGSIVLEYYSEEDLSRILELLHGES